MDIKSSLLGTFLFGALAIAGLFVAGLVADLVLVVALAIATAALAYITQCLATLALVVEDQAYGPSVSADDDGMYDKIMARARSLHRWSTSLQLLTICVGIAAWLLLVLLA